MEYASNGELFDYIISKTRLDEIEACKFFHQIVSACEYLHKLKIVHRDLKPENILITAKKELKIIDFGLSNYYSNSELKTQCGSPCYAAPEMFGDDTYDGLKSDVWSTGIILYAMLCGYLPFDEDDDEVLVKKIQYCEYDFPHFLSEEAKDLITKILCVDVGNRFDFNQIKNHSWFNLLEFKENDGIFLDKNVILVILFLK